MSKQIRFAIAKGRMYDQVVRLLLDSGVQVRGGSRDYRPHVGLEGFETKILKPRAIVEMLAEGARDVGFAGLDWVKEFGVGDRLVEVLDTGLDPVRIVAAAPKELFGDGDRPRVEGRPLVVASEYVELSRGWIETEGFDATLLRSYGATEVLPPEDADVIVDNTATGSTLRANGLRIFAELMKSSTRLFASREAWADPEKKAGIENLKMLLLSVIDARKRVMIEVNVQAESLEGVVGALECMREPTVSSLHHDAGYAVKAAVPRSSLATVIPLVKERGGTDIIVTTPNQIVP